MDIQVKDKVFTEYISKAEVERIVKNLASKVDELYKDKNPLFLVMLNGAFVFASDFLRYLKNPCETQFVKYTSYEGLGSTGKVSASQIPDIVKERHVVILEDIVDSGLTMDVFLKDLKSKGPASVALASLLSKPSARKIDVKIDFVGREIENKFIVGYGLDYDGFGRNLPALYVLKEY